MSVRGQSLNKRQTDTHTHTRTPNCVMQGLVANPLADDRFAAMFEEEDFAVDEQSAEYRLLHPNVRVSVQHLARSCVVKRAHARCCTSTSEQAHMY